jgi:hypothetical protein
MQVHVMAQQPDDDAPQDLSREPTVLKNRSTFERLNAAVRSGRSALDAVSAFDGAPPAEIATLEETFAALADAGIGVDGGGVNLHVRMRHALSQKTLLGDAHDGDANESTSAWTETKLKQKKGKTRAIKWFDCFLDCFTSSDGKGLDGTGEGAWAPGVRFVRILMGGPFFTSPSSVGANMMMMLGMTCGWIVLYFVYGYLLLVHPLMQGAATCACIMIGFHSWHTYQISKLWRVLCKNEEKGRGTPPWPLVTDPSDSEFKLLPGTPPYGPAFHGRRLRGLQGGTTWAIVGYSVGCSAWFSFMAYSMRPLPNDIMVAYILSMPAVTFMACYWVSGNCLAIACSNQVVRTIEELREQINSATDLRGYRHYVFASRGIHEAIQLLSKTLSGWQLASVLFMAAFGESRTLNKIYDQSGCTVFFKTVQKTLCQRQTGSTLIDTNRLITLRSVAMLFAMIGYGKTALPFAFFF